MKPWREGVRAVVLDPSDRILLVRFSVPPYPWAGPGGGLDPGESHEQALRRELAEEIGLDTYDLDPCIWTREHLFDLPAGAPRYRGQRERIYLVRSEAFEPAPRIDLVAELVTEVRWWTLPELEASEETFSPRRLPELLRELIERGPPAQTLDVGV